MEELGAAGVFTLGDNPLSEAWDGVVSSRAGYFARKEVSYDAVLREDGSANVSIETTLHNDAPEGLPSLLLGLDGSGYYAADVSVYLPANAGNIQSVPVGGLGFSGLIEAEFGRPVALENLNAESGGTSAARTTFWLPPPETQGHFQVDITPLPSLNPEQTTIAVELPPGAVVKGTSAGATISGSIVTWKGTYVVPTNVWVDY